MTSQSDILDVAVVGAGLSGLAVASRLLRNGLSVKVFEASSRVGGRILSCRVENTDEYLGDLGPAWCWPPYQPVLARWLDDLGVSPEPQYTAGKAVIERDRHQAVLQHDLPTQDGMTRVAGGPQAIIDALAGHIDASLIHTDHKITSVTAGIDQLDLSVEGKPYGICARQVVMALPLRVQAQQITFEPQLNSERHKLMLQAPTWMAAQAKVVIQYQSPFWREQGLSGRVASQVGPMVEVHDHSGPSGSPAALFGFIGTPAHSRAANTGALKAAIIDQLVHCFGSDAENPQALHLQDWALDSLICSDLDRTEASSHPSTLSDVVRQSDWQRRLHFSVAELSTVSPGLLEGALHSADTVVDALINQV